MISIFVPGEPVAKARPRHTRAGRTYTPSKTTNYEKAIAALAKQQMVLREPTRAPVVLDLVLSFPVTEGWQKWKQEAALKNQIAHTAKPDVDNVVKAIKDALNGVVYHDDAQVTEIHVIKLYSDKPGVQIDLTEQKISPMQITRRDQLLLPKQGSKVA